MDDEKLKKIDREILGYTFTILISALVALFTAIAYINTH